MTSETTKTTATEFHVEMLCRHPEQGKSYAKNFCGGQIVRTLESWDEAMAWARAHVGPEPGQINAAYVTEREAATENSKYAPLVRFEFLRA